MIDVKDAPSIKEKLPYFCELIGEVDIVVGHNISFDI
jgi:DNA polymerase III epsilon subunit-like protein